MPEAAVDEDRDGVPGQYEVGRAARSDLTVQSKTEPEGVDGTPEGLLRFGVPYAAASKLCAPGRAHPSFVRAHEAMLSPWAATPWACSGGRLTQMIREPAELDVDEAGRVELPLGILAEAGISPGTRLLVFSDGDGRIVLRRVEDAINDLLGEGTL